MVLAILPPLDSDAARQYSWSMNTILFGTSNYYYHSAPPLGRVQA